MRILCLFVVCGLSACATREVAPPPSAERPSEAQSGAAGDAVIVTRYELGTYRYPKDPAGKEVTAIYRPTRVPPMVATQVGASATSNETGGKYVPASFDPLPPSAELAAELASQKRITEDLRAIKASMVAMEQRARAQYDELVHRTEAAVKARRQLEAQVARVRELEAQLRERLQSPPQAAPAPAPTPASTEAPRW